MYNNKSYVNNVYPVDLLGSAGYIQFADLVNKRNEIKYLYDLLSIYSSIDSSIPEMVIVVNKKKTTSFAETKSKVLAKLNKLHIDTEGIKQKIKKIRDDLKKNETEKLQTMKYEVKEFKSNNIKQHCEIKVLDFIKTLFEYFRFFAPEAVPNIDNVSNLKDLPKDGIYGKVFSVISDIDNIDIKKIFTNYKDIRHPAKV